jgi:hypothetical protein
MLLDNIKRYDKEKKIKLVSIDELLTKNINIENKIHSVPAFMILPSKEILFGKDVFDHLLLPGRGLLYQDQNTRLENKITLNSEKTENNDIIPISTKEEGEPMAFTLKSFNFSDNFSSLEDCEEELKDKNYNWDFISNDKNISDDIKLIDTSTNNDEKSTKEKLPSLEELQKIRDNIKY